ncbi:MAG: copper chaperone Copz family protein [Ignavibacteria bacterium]|nr:copper chaperone Copz family protein [Ignavibacteria bacterium]MBI3766296.1 copper chaperone Copz family protein [Ignavibacteriales bacterium]
MNNCCVQPIEVIAEDKHKVGDECCLVTDTTPAPARAQCPVSRTVSKKVQKRTLEHLLKPEKIGSIQNVQYYYCADSNCRVVYFSNESVPYFTIDDVRVKAFAKDKGEDVSVCYCFDWTRARIKQELVSTGKSTASLQIAKEVKAGNCACDIKNPKGECCLGDVNSFVKSITPAVAPA